MIIKEELAQEECRGLNNRFIDKQALTPNLENGDGVLLRYRYKYCKECLLDKQYLHKEEKEYVEYIEKYYPEYAV